MWRTRTCHKATGFAVTVSVVGGGRVTGSGIDCRSKCTINNLEVLELTATHDAGHQFLGWSGTPCARFRNKAQCQVALTDKAKVTATFSPLRPTGVSRQQPRNSGASTDLTARRRRRFIRGGRMSTSIHFAAPGSGAVAG